jgi:hydroxypyruvate isomerase
VPARELPRRHRAQRRRPRAGARDLRREPRYAAAAFAKEGVLLVIEPINPRTIPGFHLNTSRQALAIMRAVGSDNLKLQYDLFHMQIVEGDLAKTIEANLAAIGHVQFADVPDRHEPGTGEVNFDFLFGWLDRVGYRGWVGAEYVPAQGTAASLGWFKRHSQ